MQRSASPAGDRRGGPDPSAQGLLDACFPSFALENLEALLPDMGSPAMEKASLALGGSAFGSEDGTSGMETTGWDPGLFDTLLRQGASTDGLSDPGSVEHFLATQEPGIAAAQWPGLLPDPASLQLLPQQLHQPAAAPKQGNLSPTTPAPKRRSPPQRPLYHSQSLDTLAEHEPMALDSMAAPSLSEPWALDAQFDTWRHRSLQSDLLASGNWREGTPGGASQQAGSGTPPKRGKHSLSGVPAYPTPSPFGAASPQASPRLGQHGRSQSYGTLPALPSGFGSPGMDNLHEAQIVDDLKGVIATLSPWLRICLRDSLYRISRASDARATGAQLPKTASKRHKDIDHITAGMMYHPRVGNWPYSPMDALPLTGALGSFGLNNTTTSPLDAGQQPGWGVGTAGASQPGNPVRAPAAQAATPASAGGEAGSGAAPAQGAARGPLG